MDFTPPVFAVALSSLLSVMPFSTQAQTESRGLYATIYAQSTRLGSTMFDEIGNAGLGSGVKASFGAGLGLGGDIGFRYGNGWAAELEWNWRRHRALAAAQQLRALPGVCDSGGAARFIETGP